MTGESEQEILRAIVAIVASQRDLFEMHARLCEAVARHGDSLGRIADSVLWAACPECGRCRTCHQDVTHHEGNAR